jgi:hypothetical protein
MLCSAMMFPHQMPNTAIEYKNYHMALNPSIRWRLFKHRRVENVIKKFRRIQSTEVTTVEACIVFVSNKFASKQK